MTDLSADQMAEGRRLLTEVNAIQCRIADDYEDLEIWLVRNADSLLSAASTLASLRCPTCHKIRLDSEPDGFCVCGGK